ncbi:MAG: endonuclease III [Candidatus Sericytochromatia bacterium]|nr:endonuclease III [Candidatus Sericytochromatia bacterium]
MTGGRPWRPKPAERARVGRIWETLAELYPDARTELEYRNAFELLCAVMLSAQCTDVRVNLVTPGLFARFPDADSLARAEVAEVADLIRSCGLWPAKSRNLVGMARQLLERHDGAVPRRREDLEALPGVGRKTANVVLAQAFDQPALAVDTHVFRVARRLGLSRASDVRGVEEDLGRRLAPECWAEGHHWLILHGRRVCMSRRPRCAICPLRGDCPGAEA